MPLIPMIRSQALGNVPAPVLDRAARPTLDSSQQIAAVGKLGSIKAPELPMSLAAPSEALGSIGKGIQQAGGVLEALGQKQRQAETDVQVAEADNSMLAERSSFEQWKTEHPDPSDWSTEWEKRLSTLKQNVLSNSKLHPDAAEQIGLRLTRYSGQSMADVQTSAAKETFAKAKNTFTATVLGATDAQDQGKFDEALKTGEQRGYFWPHEVEAAKQNFAKVGEQKQKEAEAAAYDQGEQAAVTLAEGHGLDEALKEIDKGTLGNFNPTDKERLRNRARLVSSQRGAEAADGLVNGVLSGQINSGAAIDAVDNPHLTPKLREEAKSWLERRDVLAEKLNKDENGVRNAVDLRQKVKDYNPASDPDRTGYFNLVKEIGSSVEQSMAGELTGELYRKYGTEPPKLKVRPEIQQNVSKSLDTIFDKEHGAIPWVKPVPVLDAKGRPEKNADGTLKTKLEPDLAARQRAIDAESRIEMKMADWYRDNPEKAQDLNAVKKQLREVLPEGTRAGALEIMQKKLPAAQPSAAATGPLNDQLVSTVKGLEQFTPHAYGDFKQTSVGYGTRAKSHDETLTEPQADARLREELSMHAGRIDKAAQATGVRLTPGQRNALISFDFNTGQGAELLQSSGGKLDEVKRRMALYTHAGGQKLDGLVNRRQKEISLFGL